MLDAALLPEDVLLRVLAWLVVDDLFTAGCLSPHLRRAQQRCLAVDAGCVAVGPARLALVAHAFPRASALRVVEGEAVAIEALAEALGVLPNLAHLEVPHGARVVA
jgi:hypothetical protein